MTRAADPPRRKHRPGAGAPRGNRNNKRAEGGRARMRALVDDPERIERFRAALDRALDGDDAGAAVQAYIRVFEHGYGRPPQALDVRGALVAPGEQPIYRASFGGGEPFDLPDDAS